MPYLPILRHFWPRASRAFAVLAFATMALGQLHAATMTLNWSDNSSNESGFKIERATGTSGAFAQVATTAANVRSFVDTGLAASTLYRYRVRAFNAAGNSAYTNIASGTTPASGNTAPTLSAISNRTIAKDGTTGAISITVGDAETSAASLTLSGSSSNTTLVPNANITFGGSGSNRTVTVKPAAGRTGTATITVRVSDGTTTASRAFTLTVSGTTTTNTAPSITAIANQFVVANTSTAPLAFTIRDTQTAASSLQMIVNTSNKTLVPLSNITLGGSGENRTITVRPASNATGWSTVWVKVSDGSLSTTTSFVVNVSAASAAQVGPNTAPTITSIANQTVAVNGTTAALAFTIRDSQTSAGSLDLTVNASDKTLIPLSNITLGGSGENRTITVRPLNNTTGWSTIWVKVSDGSLTKTMSFVVNVVPLLSYADIGSPALAGKQTVSGTTITLTAGGKDIWSTSDQFRLGRISLPGDSEMTVKVSSVAYSHASAKAGIMYRASTAANAANVFLCVTPANGIVLQYRSTTGATTASKRTSTTTVPAWLKLTRTGDTFYAFQSADGVTWKLFDSVTVNLPDTAVAGLALTSHNASATSTARFESFDID